MAKEDAAHQAWRVDFQYRKVRGVHHALRWADTGELGPHLTDPYRL